MRKELLIDATPPETRVALLEDGRVVEVLHERHGRQGLVGNVYLGRVHRVLPGMQAAFVSIGIERDAFLYVQDAALRGDVQDAAPRSADLGFSEDPEDAEKPRADADERPDRPRIEELVSEGDDVLVQVTKDPLGGKGPRVSAAISLAGRTLVYLPGASGVGISRRLTDAAERDRLRAILEAWPSSGGWIARTAALGKPAEDLRRDFAYLTGLESRIRRRRDGSSAPALIHRELELALRSVRDLAGDDCDAILVDDPALHERLRDFLEEIAPPLVARLELYEGEKLLFDRYGVETEIENGLKTKVALPSGGSLAIHQTEALVAIDVNTGKFVGNEGGLEETVFATNLEAVPEVARQIRLRDLGGLLVVDFIDMEEPDHRRALFERFEQELARDRARTRILQLSEFGLIEVTRQRMRSNLERVLTKSCPHCGGSGRTKTDWTVALDLRRALLKPPVLFTAGDVVRVRVRPGVARLCAEEDPELLGEVENRLSIRIELIPDEGVPPAGFALER